MLATSRGRRASAQKSYAYVDPLKDVEDDQSASEDEGVAVALIKSASPKMKVEVEADGKSPSASPGSVKGTAKAGGVEVQQMVDSSNKLVLATQTSEEDQNSPTADKGSMDVLLPAAQVEPSKTVKTSSDLQIHGQHGSDSDAEGEDDDVQSDFEMDTSSEDSYEAYEQPVGKGKKGGKAATSKATPTSSPKRKKGESTAGSPAKKVKADPDAPSSKRSPVKKVKADPDARRQSSVAARKFVATPENRLAIGDAMLTVIKPAQLDFAAIAATCSGGETAEQLAKYYKQTFKEQLRAAIVADNFASAPKLKTPLPCANPKKGSKKGKEQDKVKEEE